MSYDQEFRQFEVTELLAENAELRELVLLWQGMAHAATAHFGHVNEVWNANLRELDEKTQNLLEENE